MCTINVLPQIVSLSYVSSIYNETVSFSFIGANEIRN